MRRPAVASSVALATCLLASGCDPFFVCRIPSDEMLARVPQRLSQTGLYEDIDSGEIMPGVLAYRPQFKLWSDGADKRRFFQIPAGTTIDTTDMDMWKFPEGTKVWKEFSRDGVKIETRLLEKAGPDDADWAAIAYVWNAEGSDAIAAPTGFIDAGQTTHDVPAAGECAGCHGGRESFVLSISAIQLSATAVQGEVGLEELGDLGLLSNPAPEAFVVPGDETERAALGYIHANCGHCHSQVRPGKDVAPCFDPNNKLDFWLTTDDLASPQETPTYQSVGGAIKAGNPGGSELIKRIKSRKIFTRMPPLGTEVVHDDAVDLLSRWIEGIR